MYPKIIEDFVRMCEDGYKFGFNEANGGNSSYRMTPEEIKKCGEYLDLRDEDDWVNLNVDTHGLAGEYFIVTAAGSLMRNVAIDIPGCLGIVQLNDEGNAYRIIWGLEGGRPTSEFGAHLLNHSVRKTASGGKDRVMYHLHPESLVALTYILPLDDKVFTNVLWKSMTECVMVIPGGVGVVKWLLPGSNALALATCDKMQDHQAVVWAHHGLFVTGRDFDDAFGRAHTIEKSASIYNKILQSGKPVLNTITDDDLISICDSLGLTINKSMFGE
ncbi:MAG: rhamnulose-1-phosphate aldolase [Lachnospiraceae bacterium]|nr:rhamnulose-1-phosphate aldolase [Lachnospiraceae bacterium]